MSGARVLGFDAGAGDVPASDWGKSLSAQNRLVAQDAMRAYADALDAVRMEAAEEAQQWVAGVAHDFNNVLSAIRLNCDRLRAGARDQEQVLLLSRRIQGLAEFAQRQVEELLMLGRFDASEASSRVNDIVRGMLPLLRQLCSEVELGARFESGGGEVGVSAARLRQVVLNLVLNARDAAGGGGRIRIETSRRRTSAGGLRTGVLLSVWNSGSALSRATRRNMQAPFFSSKGEDGHGWGLWTIRRVIADAGGEMRIAGRKKKGTRVTVLLPGRQGRSAGFALLQNAISRPVRNKARKSVGSIRRAPC
jgi:two-component system, cell cycle sensor histidine kinase and response regulator CckA